MSSNNWANDLQRTNVAAQDLAYLIGERDNQRRSGTASSDLNGQIRGKFNNLERTIDRLERELKEQEANPTQFKLSAKDITSRRDNLRKLVNEKQRLKTLEKQFVSSDARDSLLSNGDGKKYGNGESEKTREFTSQQLMEKTKDDMKEQDAILDVMSKGLDNLKNMGSTIKDEADLHLRLLDDIEDQVEKGDSNLKRETARTAFITKQSSTCWLYTTICVLLAVLIALIAVRWA
jgi:hypothetical protein